MQDMGGTGISKSKAADCARASFCSVARRSAIMVWMVPCGIAMCQVGSCKASTEGSHFWIGLSRSASPWPSPYFRVRRVSDREWTRDRPPGGIYAEKRVVVRRRLRRAQILAFFKRLAPCIVGMEACSSAHHWARELTGLGHEVRLMKSRDRGAAAQARRTTYAGSSAPAGIDPSGNRRRRPQMQLLRRRTGELRRALLAHDSALVPDWVAGTDGGRLMMTIAKFPNPPPFPMRYRADGGWPARYWFSRRTRAPRPRPSSSPGPRRDNREVDSAVPEVGLGDDR